MRSLQLGTYDNMFKGLIESYSGYIQVQHPDFLEDPVVDNIIEFSDTLQELLLGDPGVKDIIPRFESFALASAGSRTKGSIVMGIDPEKEKKVSDIESRLVKFRLTGDIVTTLLNGDIPGEIKKNIENYSGFSWAGEGKMQLELGIKDRDTASVMPLLRKYASAENKMISSGREGALLGEGLAAYLGLSTGDTLVLLSQGYHGVTAAGKYVVEGIVTMPSPDIDNKIVYLPADVCQQLFGAEGMVTSLVLEVEDNSYDAVEESIQRIDRLLPEDKWRIVSWREMNATLVSQLDADNKSGMIMIGILYLVIAFGVFGTVLMMTAERRREFGVLIAIGMQKGVLASVITMEMVYIGLLGIVAGVAAALPVIFYGFYHPIRLSSDLARIFEDYGFEPVMAFAWPGSYILWQSLVIAVIVILALLYPVYKIYAIKEIDALKA
jgi:ABC-type lipoprotein release transport system permease subunit